MKFPARIIVLLCFACPLAAQQPAASPFAVTDRTALQIPDSQTRTSAQIARYITAHFTSERDKARAAFIWVASNIRYDVDNMFAINFYEKREEKIVKALLNRKGICEHYAALFTDVCNKSGLKAYVVEGYTKQNGFTDYIPHAWSAVRIDSTWFLFDPTWGSGYISNGKFVRKINEAYFMAPPERIVRSHMPFDYLWQFSSYPATNQEFYEGKTQEDHTKPAFRFADTLRAWELQSHTQQLASAAYRIERNGVRNSMIFDRLQHIKMELENAKQNATVQLYNDAVADYNDGVNAFNEFINFRNKQFTPEKKDAQIQEMLDLVRRDINSATSKLKQIGQPDASTGRMTEQLSTSVNGLSERLNEQQTWLNNYFRKSKFGRKSMFYERKVTVFGVPVN